MKNIILLELFSGMGKISQSVKNMGGQAFTVDWSDKIDSDLKADVSKLTVNDVIKLCGRVPDVIWASPQCTSYSIATHRHRTLKEGLKPKTELAEYDDFVNIKLWELIDKLLALGAKYYFVENPKGRMRHMPFVVNRPRYTITYCSYGNKGNANGYEDIYSMKPTDIWTNHPNPRFLPTCSKPYPHEHGNQSIIKKRDYISRGEMPEQLTNAIAHLVTEIYI